MAMTVQQFIEMLRRVALAIEAASSQLCELDGAVADGDHGITMAIGWKAVTEALEALDLSSNFRDICTVAAKAFLKATGATAGPLYSTALIRAGAAVDGCQELDAAAMVEWIRAAAQGIKDRGKADLGDKTMIDAWLPAVREAETALAAGGDVSTCLRAAALGAEAGMMATKNMVPQKGRASRLGARAVGHIDPGAASAAIILRAMADAASTFD